MPDDVLKSSMVIISLLVVMLAACREQEGIMLEGTTIAPITVQATQTGRTETNLAFTTLTQGDWGTNDHFYDVEEPALIVIDKPEDITLITDWVSQESLMQLLKMDYTLNLALAVFQGWKGTLEYDVQIQQISHQDGIVNVYTNFIEPEPGTEELHAEISPYHIVQVQRFEELDDKTTFDLIVNDIVIFSYPFDIIILTPTLTPPPSPYPSALSTPTSVSPYPPYP
jgi:hypothetical protein